MITVFSPIMQETLGGLGLLFIEASRLQTHSVASVGIWTTDQPVAERPLTDDTQHSQQTDIHAPGMIRTSNPSNRGPQTERPLESA
jgi:hypothetical protein